MRSQLTKSPATALNEAPGWVASLRAAKRPADAAAIAELAEAVKGINPQQLETLELAQTGALIEAGKVDDAVAVARKVAPTESEPMVMAYAGLLENADCGVDAADIVGQALVKRAYDTASVTRLQSRRVALLLAAKKPAAALVAAKSYFNVASMNDTAAALLSITHCLEARGDAALVSRFEAEQQRGAATPTATGSTSAQPPATEPTTDSVLGAVHVDPAPYEAALANYPGDDYGSMLARGNLLLLADEPEKAKKVFDQLYALAEPGQQLTDATENLARVIKAREGTIGGANGFVLKVRPK